MHYSSKVYWTIDRAREDSSEFFNMTSNRIEVSVLLLGLMPGRYATLFRENHSLHHAVDEAESTLVICLVEAVAMEPCHQWEAA